MNENLTLIIAFLSGPVVLGLFAAVWKYWTTVREPARIKAGQITTAGLVARDQSLQAHSEASSDRSQAHRESVEGLMLNALLQSQDGKITGVHTKVDNLESVVVEMITSMDHRLSEAFRQVIASQNKTIGQQAQILSVLVEVIKQYTGKDILSALNQDVIAGLTAATIDSVSVQKAQGVADAATAHSRGIASEEEAVGNAPGEGMAKIEVTGKQVE